MNVKIFKLKYTGEFIVSEVGNLNTNGTGEEFCGLKNPLVPQIIPISAESGGRGQMGLSFIQYMNFCEEQEFILHASDCVLWYCTPDKSIENAYNQVFSKIVIPDPKIVNFSDLKK